MTAGPVVSRPGSQADMKGKKAAPFLRPRFKRGKGLGWVSHQQCMAPFRQPKRLKERCRKQWKIVKVIGLCGLFCLWTQGALAQPKDGPPYRGPQPKANRMQNMGVMLNSKGWGERNKHDRL